MSHPSTHDGAMNTSLSSNSGSPGNPVTVSSWLGAVRLGNPQTHRDIVVWPLFLPSDVGPTYRTLGEAVSTRQARVSEISENGSVPELKVFNGSSEPLLILDGEELIGAKQNRVVNATLLLPAHSEIVIPVSCTEQGRWRPVSTDLSSSDAVMEMKIRRAKVQSVSEHLDQGGGHKSDQGQVWEDIQALQAKSGSASPTMAMHDSFKTREQDTGAALDSFPLERSQHGLLVSIRGRVAGCDLLSRADAYSRLHGKLVRSYVLDALMEKPGTPEIDEGKVREFLTKVGQCREKRFASVGLGESVRLQSGEAAGAALSHENAVIHIAAFGFDPASAPDTKTDSMEGLTKRRRRFHRPPVQ